jgi:phenylpyruvate tautomerase
MPLIIIRTSASVSDSKSRPLLSECSKALSALTGKPETYVMTMLGRPAAMTMGGTDEPSCFVDIRGIGKITGAQAKSMSKAFCELLEKGLGVPPRRIYLNFTGTEGALWGWDGDTFA